MRGGGGYSKKQIPKSDEMMRQAVGLKIVYVNCISMNHVLYLVYLFPEKILDKNFILIPKGPDRKGVSEDTMFHFSCGRFVAPTSKIYMIPQHSINQHISW